jgi:D-3-phosphoglycerate dehydrogenase
MKRYKVLITDGLNDTGLDLLRSHPNLDLTIRKSTTPDELKKLIPDYSIVMVRSKTLITAELIGLGKKLEVIVSCGVGTDQIDTEAANQSGIHVYNCPTANTLSTAEHTLGLIFAVTRNISQSQSLIRNGVWERGESMRGIEIHGKILGIIGMGNIGRIVAEKAMALGMQVIAYDQRSAFELKLPEKFKYLENRYTLSKSMEEVLKQADILTLHIPKNRNTLNLISDPEIALMRPGSFLINCSRGGIVNESAVLNALNSGHLRGAAFDVFDPEPPHFSNPLFSHPRFTATAHLGGSTDEALDRIGAQAAQSVLEFANTRR